MRKLSIGLFCVVGLLLLSPCRLSAASTTQPAVRPAREVLNDWEDNSRRLKEVLPSPQAVFDVDKRQEAAELAMPLLRKAVSLADEMRTADSAMRDRALHIRYHSLAVMAYLGDAKAADELAEAKDSNHKVISALGRDALFFAAWWKSGDSPKEQMKILAEIDTLAKASPDNDEIASLLVSLREEGFANSTITDEIERIVTHSLRGPVAAKLAEKFRSFAKLRSLVDKPIDVSGPLSNGSSFPFSTSRLAGKVVLVHFGATWCQPWREEVEDLKKLHEECSARGLSIVEVICDKNDANVSEYLALAKLPWPTLRDAANPLSLADQYGVDTFPTMFLIDRKGILRRSDARGKLRVYVEELLQE